MPEEKTENKYKILLVEDEVNIAKLFTFNLKKAGYDCMVVYNGKQGLQALRNYNPDLIISDIMMPEMDGYEFRKKILSDNDLKTIPFIFLTAKGEDEDMLEGYDLEIQDYIVKTSSPKVTLAKVEALLKTSTQQRKDAVKEVQQAADVLGAKVVPEFFPTFNGYDIKHWHVPYQETPGGDFIDYYNIDKDNLAVVVGDVMGKKWGAWYFAIAYAGYIRSAVRFVLKSSKEQSPAEIMKQVNDSVNEDERISEIFITLSILILNSKNNTVSYCGAGDLPVMKRGNDVKAVSSKGVLLGFSKDSDYEDVAIEMKQGDELYVMTDGITEARSSAGAMLGTDGFLEIIKDKGDAGEPIDYVKERFKTFANNKFDDDISLVTIKRV